MVEISAISRKLLIKLRNLSTCVNRSQTERGISSILHSAKVCIIFLSFLYLENREVTFLELDHSWERLSMRSTKNCDS